MAFEAMTERNLDDVICGICGVCPEICHVTITVTKKIVAAILRFLIISLLIKIHSNPFV